MLSWENWSHLSVLEYLKFTNYLKVFVWLIVAVVKFIILILMLQFNHQMVFINLFHRYP